MIRRAELSKRARYYHSQMDMELLRPGNDYAELPDTYVIFICDFDPFDQWGFIATPLRIFAWKMGY